MFVVSIIILILFFALAFIIYSKFVVGDCDIQVNTPENLIYCIKDGFFYIKALCKLINKSGKQQGLVTDCFAKPRLGASFAAGATAAVINLQNPRDDGYWETYLLKPNKSIDIELIIKSPSGELLKNPEIDLFYKFYCRDLIAEKRKIIKLNSENAKEEEFTAVQSDVRACHGMPLQDKNVIPVRTHLLTEKDDMFDVIEKYVKPKAAPGDIICIAETALAIMQGRFKRAEDIRVGFLAKILNKFFKYDSSMSSVYAMQMALSEIGAPRMIAAVIMGTLGKIMGRSGDFYRLAGRDIAAIDDCGGTLPPYDKCVVMGPKDSKKVVDEIKEKTGFNAAVVDANDLGKVDILAISDDKYSDLVVEKLKKNPQGNANEQTPVVILRISA